MWGYCLHCNRQSALVAVRVQQAVDVLRMSTSLPLPPSHCLPHVVTHDIHTLQLVTNSVHNCTAHCVAWCSHNFSTHAKALDR